MAILNQPVSDFSVLLSNVGLYELAFASSGVAGAIAGPAANGFPVAPGLSLFEVGGSRLRFNTGSIAATGEYFGFPVDSTIGLSTTPLLSIFPFGSTAEVLVTDLGGGTTNLRLSLPFSALVRLVIDDSEPVTITIAGTLVATGQTVVPEPGTLLALGPGGLASRARRAS